MSSVEVGQSEQRPIPCQVVATALRYRFEYSIDLTQHRTLAFEPSESALVEGSCDHHDDPSQSSEMTTVVNEMFLCESLPAPRFPGESHQIFPQFRLVRRVFVTGAQNALHLCMVAQSLEPSLS